MSLPIVIAVALLAWLLLRKPARPRAGMPPAEARRLLEVPADADVATIAEAHRRLIARVHPDAGGSAELARRVNDARDVLLARARGSN